jgi:hypothetical protein
MVVLVIISVVSAIVATSQSNFNKTITLANTAYDVALTFRFAETYGLGSRYKEGATGNVGYGLHFQNAPSNSFVLFADTDPLPGLSNHPRGDETVCHPAPKYDDTGPSALAGNCVYLGETERVQTYTLGNNITINKFCAKTDASSWGCNIDSLDVTFSRPNPTPFMSIDGGYDGGASKVVASCVELTSPQGEFRSVVIGSSGQISIYKDECLNVP